MNLEQILSSSCRRKILIVLNEVNQTHIMNLVRLVNGTYTQVNPYLKIMGKEGIITERRISNMRIIILNRENPKTILLLKVLRILNPPTMGTPEPFVNKTERSITQKLII